MKIRTDFVSNSSSCSFTFDNMIISLSEARKSDPLKYQQQLEESKKTYPDILTFLSWYEIGKLKISSMGNIIVS